MDAALIVIDSDAELARACALVDELWTSDDPADIARLRGQAQLIAAYEQDRWPAGHHPRPIGPGTCWVSRDAARCAA
jgi:hypothetical protein